MISTSGYNPSTGNVSPKFHVVFHDEVSTVPFIREGKIPPNRTDLVQRNSQSGAKESIDLKDTWLTPELEEYPRKTQVMSRVLLQTTIIK